MRILITGATGVIGRKAVPLLIAAGHEVTAIGRSPERLEALARGGARTAAVDLFDREGLARAMHGHDAVINLATHIPASPLRMLLPGAWKENDHIRGEASALLVDVALAQGVGRFVQESFAPVYPDRGAEWISEDVPLRPVRYSRTVVDAEASARRFTERGGTGVVLRFAYFHGAGDPFTHDVLRSVRRGWLPIVGLPDAYWSMVHHQDAATAVVAALAVPEGVYNVVDDSPMTRADFGAVVADLLGVRRPRMPPAWLARLMGTMGEMLARSLRMSNRKLRAASAWAPAYPSAREGWRQALDSFADLRQREPLVPMTDTHVRP